MKIKVESLDFPDAIFLLNEKKKLFAALKPAENRVMCLQTIKTKNKASREGKLIKIQ
jgi:hypothetical protein